MILSCLQILIVITGQAAPPSLSEPPGMPRILAPSRAATGDAIVAVPDAALSPDAKIRWQVVHDNQPAAEGPDYEVRPGGTLVILFAKAGVYALLLTIDEPGTAATPALATVVVRQPDLIDAEGLAAKLDALLLKVEQLEAGGVAAVPGTNGEPESGAELESRAMSEDRDASETASPVRVILPARINEPMLVALCSIYEWSPRWILETEFWRALQAGSALPPEGDASPESALLQDAIDAHVAHFGSWQLTPEHRETLLVMLAEVRAN